MLTSQECREKIEHLDRLLVVKESMPPEEVYARYHYASLKKAYQKELLKAIAREV